MIESHLVLLGRVIGNVVSTIKDPTYEGRKILWVQPIRPDGSPKGAAMITFDTVGAGAGERVLVLQEGRGSQEVCGLSSPGPIGSAIVGIVDDVDLIPTGAPS